ncbi:MAG: hypothetical protein K0R45_2574 [Pseudomonas sp.]|nr:hypothetical protein [Pseudomonas sp.]
MEVNARYTTIQPNMQHAEGKLRTPPGDERFAQIFKNAIRPAHPTPAVPAAATLTNLVPARSIFFLQNMSIEQRRSAVQDEGFTPQAAALESPRGTGGRVLAQNAINGG